MRCSRGKIIRSLCYLHAVKVYLYARMLVVGLAEDIITDAQQELVCKSRTVPLEKKKRPNVQAGERIRV